MTVYVSAPVPASAPVQPAPVPHRRAGTGAGTFLAERNSTGTSAGTSLFKVMALVQLPQVGRYRRYYCYFLLTKYRRQYFYSKLGRYWYRCRY